MPPTTPAPAAAPQPVTFEQLWSDRHLCMLASPRRNGSIHQVPVGATWDAERRLVRIICSGSSFKARNLAANPDAMVSVSQVDGRWWSSIEGRATVSSDPQRVAEAVRRYAERYREPRPNAERVVIEIAVERFLGLRPEGAGGGTTTAM